jgi:glutamate/tyrosine decarboxylase-like PLP-dependent enzyme
MANLTGLRLARDRRDDGSPDPAWRRGRVYVCDQGHSSAVKAAAMLGFAKHQIVHVAADAAFRMDMTSLLAEMKNDPAPVAVVANAGSTNTGAIDPLNAIADLCAETGAWMHVDGAYGALAWADPRGRVLLDGIARADSLTLDPHKWLFAPFDIGCLLTRHERALEAAFDLRPEYLRDLPQERDTPSFAFRGFTLSRSLRAAKLWFGLKHHGAKWYAAAVTRAMDLARKASMEIASRPGFRVIHEPELSVVCFQAVAEGMDATALNAFNAEIAEAIVNSGDVMMSSTVLRGATCQRIVVLHPDTTWDDVLAAIDLTSKLREQALAARK